MNRNKPGGTYRQVFCSLVPRRLCKKTLDRTESGLRNKKCNMSHFGVDMDDKVKKEACLPWLTLADHLETELK